MDDIPGIVIGKVSSRLKENADNVQVWHNKYTLIKIAREEKECTNKED